MYKLLITTVCCLFLFGCGGGGGSSSGGGAGKPEVEKILVMSDSIGTGNGGVTTPFPDLLAVMTGVEVVNASTKGRLTGSAVVEVGGLIAANEPSHLIVLLGTNDAFSGMSSTAVDNLQMIIDIANEAGITAIVGAIPPIFDEVGVPAGLREDAIERGNEIVAGILGLTGAELAATRSSLSRSDIADDGVHPTAMGQQIIADVFFGRL